MVTGDASLGLLDLSMRCFVSLMLYYYMRLHSPLLRLYMDAGDQMPHPARQYT